MIHKILRERLLASTILVGAITVGAPAFAQTDAATTSQDAASAITPSIANPASGPSNSNEIVVTGSRIVSPNMQSASPITSVSGEALKLQGTTRVEDLVNQLPQAFVSQSSGVSNGASGTATINLRNLGDDRTLVLVDGHRLSPGDPSGGGSAADVNMVPSFLVKRIDVLTGGASATYGADAVAGVVNFVLDNSFEGLKVDFQGNLAQHTNGNNFIRDIVRKDPRYKNPTNGIDYPSGNTVDGASVDAAAAFGAKFDDSRGHITVFGSYHHQNPVLQSERDYTNCAVAENSFENGDPDASPLGSSRAANSYCSGSSNTAVTNFLPNAGAGSRIIVTPGTGGAGGTAGTRSYVRSRDGYNFNPTNYIQRPDTRYNVGAFANYDLNDHVKPYGSFMFMDDRSIAQIAPSGTFNNVFTINCNNPLATAAQLRALGCVAGTPTTVEAGVAKRNVEGGGRIDDLRHTDYRFVVGSKGDLFKGFSYDAYYQFGTTIYAENYQRDFSRTRVQNAINGCRNADGSAVSDATCVPYNIFTGTTTLQDNAAAGVTQGALDYVQTPGFKSGDTRENIASATIQGDLGAYGIQSPLAHSGISIAFGPEWRRESLTLNTDNEYATGDLLGQGGQTKSTSGSYSVTEGFIEARVPLAQDMPGFQDLTFNGGYRYSHYSTVGHTNTYKLELNWSPLQGDLEGLVRFRGSYNRAVRAPTVQDFYQPSQLGLGGTTDPCTNGGRSLAACRLTAIGDPNFASQYAAGLANNPASQYNSVTAGATTAGSSLKPETAITKTVGVIFEPKRLLPGFTASVDYYNINLKNRIGTDGYNTIINQCLATASTYYCGLIHRDPANGSLWLTPNGYINDPIYNAGHLKVSGIDVAGSYNFGIGKFGKVAIDFHGSYLLHNKTEVTLHNTDGTISSNGYYDCKGYYGDFCGVPNPTWRHQARVTWSPNEQLGLSVGWRHYGSTNIDAANQDLDKSGSPLIGYGISDKSYFKYDKIKTYDYIDLAVTVTTTDHLEIRAGVDNLFDRDPAIIPGADLGAGNNNGNTYPGLYDALGRTLFLGATMKF